LGCAKHNGNVTDVKWVLQIKALHFCKAWLCLKLDACRALVVTEKKIFTRQWGRIPGSLGKYLKAPKFGEFFRVRFDEDNFSRFAPEQNHSCT
jgi:hypothetical protein